MENAKASTLYETVADDIARMIHAGALSPGDRVPSLRHLSRQRRVSLSTVLLAYQSLESRGVLEARPQSGYYVRAPRVTIAEPAPSRPPRAPQPVGVTSLVSRFLQDAGAPGLAPFGAAIPDPQFMPTAMLGRAVSSVVRRQRQVLGQYTLPPGRIELRRQIALRARDWGVQLDPEEIIITNGCMEAVSLCLCAVARPGDVIALESPTYFGLLQTIESLGMRALEIPTHPTEGLSLDSLRQAIGRGRVKACIVMPIVSNPLGGTMSDRAKRQLVRLLAEHDIPLIEDNVFSALYFGRDAPYAAKAFDRKGMVMLCASFTKTLAPGLRVGWAAPGRYYEQVRMLKFVHSAGVSDLPQLAVAHCLQNGGYERVLRGQRRLFAGQIEQLRAAIARSFPLQTRISQPTGGYLLWVEMPAAIDVLKLYDAALKHKISFAPGPMFSASNRYRNCLRVNCALQWTPALDEAIARLGDLAGAQLHEAAH